MGPITSQITSLTIVYSTVYSDADQRKHQSSALLAFVRGIHRGPVNSPQKWPVMRKMFPFDDVIIHCLYHGSWWPGDLRGIISHGSDSVHLEHSTCRHKDSQVNHLIWFLWNCGNLCWGHFFPLTPPGRKGIVITVPVGGFAHSKFHGLV